LVAKVGSGSRARARTIERAGDGVSEVVRQLTRMLELGIVTKWIEPAFVGPADPADPARRNAA
jgi:hypothetical protein